MKLTLRILCGVTIVLTLVALILYMIPGHLAQVGSIVDLAGKIAIGTALIAVMIASQRAQWRWVAYLVIAGVVALMAGPLSGQVVFYFLGPLVAAAVALSYSFRMGDAGPRYRIGDNGRTVAR